MHNDLLYSTKKRMLDILNTSVSQNPKFKDIAKAYHSYHMKKERPQVGVRLNTSSGTRLKQSPDDALAELYSRVVLLPFPGKPNASVSWVWEDVEGISKPITLQDVSNRLNSDRTRLLFNDLSLTMGIGNPVPAKGYGPCSVFINGKKTMHMASEHAVDLMGATIPAGAEVLMSYCVRKMATPAYYILEMVEPAREGPPDFMVRPLYTITREMVIRNTNGTEPEVQLRGHGSYIRNKAFALWTQKTPYSERFYLKMGEDYTVSESGLVTFLVPVRRGTFLFATYRYYGELTGPFPIPHEHFACTTAISGVTLAFCEGASVGDRQIVAVLPESQRVANVRGSHYEMNVDLTVFSRDPQSSAELCDHIISDIWGNRRYELSGQGFTILDMDPGGDGTESYNDPTTDFYFTNSVSFRVMVEWHKITPYLEDVQGFDVSLFQVEEFSTRSHQSTGTDNSNGQAMTVTRGEFLPLSRMNKGPAFI